MLNLPFGRLKQQSYLLMMVKEKKVVLQKYIMSLNAIHQKYIMSICK